MMKIVMFDYFRTYSSNAHQVCCENSLTEGLYDHCLSHDLDLDARSQWVGKGKKISVECSWQTKQAISIKPATTVGHFFYVTLTLQAFVWLDHLVLFSLSHGGGGGGGVGMDAAPGLTCCFYCW